MTRKDFTVKTGWFWTFSELATVAVFYQQFPFVWPNFLLFKSNFKLLSIKQFPSGADVSITTQLMVYTLVYRCYLHSMQFPFHFRLYQPHWQRVFSIRKCKRKHRKANYNSINHFIYSIILNPFIPIHISVAYLFVSIWSCYFLAEQLCILFCVFVKSRINVAVAVSYIVCICVALSSGTVRSFKGLHPFLQDYNKIVHTKYASALLHSAVFLSRTMKCEESASISCPAPADYLVSRLGDSDVEVIQVTWLLYTVLAKKIFFVPGKSFHYHCCSDSGCFIDI